MTKAYGTTNYSSFSLAFVPVAGGVRFSNLLASFVSLGTNEDIDSYLDATMIVL